MTIHGLPAVDTLEAGESITEVGMYGQSFAVFDSPRKPRIYFMLNASSERYEEISPRDPLKSELDSGIPHATPSSGETTEP